MLYFEDFDVGQSRSAGIHELTEADIIAFARQWDPQPWHVDPEAATLTHGGLSASSCHTYSIAALLLNRMEPVAGIASLKHEIELPNPARPGDRLTLTMTCVDKRASETKPDRGLLTFDGVLANQHGLPVLKLRSLMLVRRRPDDTQPGPAGMRSRIPGDTP
jgi:acyl dehydratase